MFVCTFTFQTSRLRIGTVTGRTELAHGPVGLDAARRVGRARDVRAGVDATEVHARLVLRAPGVPETHRRGGRAAVGAHAHGPVVERQALLAGGTRAVVVARATALASGNRAPQVRRAVSVGPALAVRRRARELAQLGDGEPVLAPATRPVTAHHARLGRLARESVARVPACAVGRARPGRRAVLVPVAPSDGHVVAGPLRASAHPGASAAARIWRAPHGGIARVTIRARALRPVQHRPAERVQAASVSDATRVHATSRDAGLFVCTLTVVGAFDRWRDES